MKKIKYFSVQNNFFYYVLLLNVFFSLNLFSQIKISPAEKYSQLGLVWGLLKYHHPEISKGKCNWDVEFISLYDKANGVDTQESLNNLLITFVERYNKNANYKDKKGNAENLFFKNSDYNWINEKVFGEKLTKNLNRIKENGNISDFYTSFNSISKQLTFSNEKGFKGFDSDIESHRLLLLFSFWNAIEYWDVNKHLADENWQDILIPMTEAFLKNSTKLEFEILKAELVSKLNDSHAFYCSSIVNDSLFKYKPVFEVSEINDSLLIKTIYNTKLANMDGITLGDIIVKINDQNIPTYTNKKLSHFLSASNTTFLKQWSTWLLYNKDNTINVEIVDKNGGKTNKKIHLYDKYAYEDPFTLIPRNTKKWFLIKPDIAYIDLEQITDKELSGTFKEIAATKGVIIDLRNYPKNISNVDIAKYLYPDKKEFIKVLFPLKNNPSMGEYDGKNLLHFIANAFVTGKNNPNYYKGKVILLVDRKTMSNAEFIGMTIQQAPNCITVGEETSGAVMNIVQFTMPDKQIVSFTGLGAYYLNGETVQRKGLHIDYYLKENAKKYDPHLYIKEAIKIIENN